MLSLVFFEDNFFLGFLVHFIELDAEVINDKLLTSRGIFSHIKVQDLVQIAVVQQHWLQSYVLANKSSKLIRRDLTQPLEACNFNLASKRAHRLLLLILAI